MSKPPRNTEKVYTYLNGGLGNQMFQYAVARSISQRTGAELVLDTWSGFVRDTVYRRNYELDALPIQARVASPWERLPIWIYRAHRRYFKSEADPVQDFWYGRFLVETDFAFLKAVANADVKCDTWLNGYWQSPCYFQECEEIIHNELRPPTPIKRKFLELGEQLRYSESVALGIRLYEEAPDPRGQARDGRIKTAEEISAAIMRLREGHPHARFYVFCTHRSPLLEQLQLPSGSSYVTHDDGYEGTLDRLWLLSQCRHHLFTNSSYYWWGAWLSRNNYSREDQVIMAADNFINIDGYCPGWEKF